MGPRREKGPLGGIPNQGTKPREGREPCLHCEPGRPPLELKKHNYLAQCVLFRKGNQQWWKVWKLNHLRNIITLLEIATQVPPVYSIFLIAFSRPNIQHSLLSRQFVVHLPPGRWRYFTVLFTDAPVVRRTMPDTSQMLSKLNELMHYFIRIVDAFKWKRESLDEMLLTFKHLNNYLYFTVITSADSGIIKTWVWISDLKLVSDYTQSVWITSVFTEITKEIENPSIWD